MIKVINAMEEIVDQWIFDIVSEFDGCMCEKCLADIKAIALNRLPPKYYVTEEGKIYNKIEELKIQYRVDIISAIAIAAHIVRANPRHTDSVSNQRD